MVITGQIALLVCAIPEGEKGGRGQTRSKHVESSFSSFDAVERSFPRSQVAKFQGSRR